MSYTLSNFPAQVSAFDQQILQPNILAWEKAGIQPQSLFSSAAEHGLLSIETPCANGGLGGSYLDKLAMARQLSHHSMAAAFAIINSQNIAARLSTSAEDHHRNILAPALRAGELVGCTALTEPHAGSDFAAITTSAQKKGDGWVLNGEKAWITNGANADIIMLYAQTDPDKGWRGIASFLVDAREAGFQRHAPFDLIGGAVIGAGGFSLNNYHLTDRDMFAPPGEAFKIAMTSINGARTYVAAMCVGMMEHALEVASNYSKERSSFGTAIFDHQGVKWSLVDVYAHIQGLKTLVQQAGVKIANNEDAILPAALAKKMAGEVTLPALTTCVQAMGAHGLLAEHLIGHHMACAKIAAFTDGSTEMMNERIASYI
jgi:alkylation response protein AidB-like acyl-CoA dehydrogenase